MASGYTSELSVRECLPPPLMNAGLSAADVSRIHANVFRLVSSLFLVEPPKALLDQLALDEAWEMIGMFVEQSAYQPLRELAQSRQLSAPDLSLEFHALFTVPLGSYVFPFESCYRVATPPGPLMGPPAIEVQSAYAAAGFALAPQQAEPPDHIGLELAFVAELLDRHAAARGAGEDETAAAVAGQIQSFCRGHLTRWLPTLRDRITASGASAFYAAAGTLAANLVERVVALPATTGDSGQR